MSCDDFTEMTSNLLRITEASNGGSLSTTRRRSGNERAMTSFAFRLPPELLAAIFLRYAEDYRDSTRVPRWVTVSYVCQYWRNVALNCAKLWTYLFFVSPEWMDEQLRRSKAAPLIARVDFSRSQEGLGPIRALDKALQNVNRIQDLRVDDPYVDTIDLIHARLNAAAPLLESLHLSAMYCPDSHFTIPENTFPGASPLQKVYLEICHVDWSSRIFNGLTELTLRIVLNDFEESWDGVLRILRQSPNLRRLCLSEVLPSSRFGISSIGSEDITGPITLPRLEELTLTDSIIWVMCLLVRLEFPRTTTVRLDCTFDDSRAISMLLSLIPDRFSHPTLLQSGETAQTVFQYLDLRYTECAWKLAYGTPRLTDTGSNIFWLKEKDLGSQIVSTHVDGLDPNDFLPWFRVFPLSHVNVLALHSIMPREIDGEYLWTEVFRDASELRSIGMELGCVENLIHALQPRDGMILVPSLTDIRFLDIEFMRGECLGWLDRDGKGCLQCLHSALASRAQAGIVLQRLVLEYCEGITEDDATELSKVVGRVEWTYSTQRGNIQWSMGS